MAHLSFATLAVPKCGGSVEDSELPHVWLGLAP